jgi:CBS domain-containing protein
MRVRDAMTTEVQHLGPDCGVQEAAQLMAEIDAGAVLVVADRRPIGILTDRDIIIRVVAEGRDAATRIGEVMSSTVLSCREDDALEHVGQAMEEKRIRRMPVVDDEGSVVGIISLGDIAAAAAEPAAHDLLQAAGNKPGSDA